MEPLPALDYQFLPGLPVVLAIPVKTTARLESRSVDNQAIERRPLVVDAEGDAIIFEFSGLSASCPAISCEGFGESEEVLNQFRCKVNEMLMVPACNGTHKIVVIITDNSGDA